MSPTTISSVEVDRPERPVVPTIMGSEGVRAVSPRDPGALKGIMRVVVTVGTTDVLVECEGTTPAETIAGMLGPLGVSPVELGTGAAGETFLHGARVPTPTGALEERNPHDLQLHVVSGPDSGAVFGLPIGRHVVGAGSLVWRDSAVARGRLVLDVRVDGVTLVCLGSRVACSLDGNPCEEGEPTHWGEDQLLEFGDSVLALGAAEGAGAVVEPAGPGWLRFVRPPRVRDRPLSSTIEFPAAPEMPRERRISVVSILLPAVLGAAMAIAMSNPMYLAFALMSPVMMTANHLVDRRGTRRDYARALKDYGVRHLRAEELLERAIAVEQRQRRSSLPDPAQTLMASTIPTRRLWERRRDDADSLLLRVALGERPSGAQVRGGGPPRSVRLVPIDLDLRVLGVVGIAGESSATDGVLRWLIGQLATFHAPNDLAMVFLTISGGAEWNWLRWLPHLRPAEADIVDVQIGHNVATVGACIDALVALIRTREFDAERASTSPSFAPVVVVVHDYPSLRAHADLALILAKGPAVGIHAICTAPSDLLLPERATAVIAFEADEVVRASLRLDGSDPVRALAIEQVSLSWAERLSRALAPYQTLSGSDSATELQTGVSLLDLLAVEPSDVNAAVRRWGSSQRGTEVVIGQGLEGPVAFDLHDDGPHVLIAGMSGSGKTELLQSIICSLAVSNRPEQMNFVLIDYKGDSAFKDCADLPHTVGKVNDLDPAEVRRALESLRAELDRRKRVLAVASAKDIDTYHRLSESQPALESLPRLVIVIDEFAELVKELPEFMDGLVSIAQVGRSLGVHLILATQRPHGVVSPAIRANTGIRIALRVADAVDSTDVLGTAEAAEIPPGLAGRGFMRRGTGRCVPFQTGRVSGHAASASAKRQPSVALHPWRTVGQPEQNPPVASSHEILGESELAALVRMLGLAASAENAPAQRRPWLDPLPGIVLWNGESDDRGSGRSIPPLPLGRQDVPTEQWQGQAFFDLEQDTHLYVVGMPGSGRSQVLRTLVGSIARLTSPDDVHVYGLDCSTGALLPMTALPHCGAVVTRTEPDRAMRLLERFIAEVSRRQRDLADHGWPSITEQRRGSPQRIPHLVLVVDGWEGLPTMAGDPERMGAALRRLLREGASSGIHVVIAGDRSLLLQPGLSALTDHKLVLGLAEKSDYLLAGLNPKAMPDRVPPGRCRGRAGTEIQVYLLSDDSSGQAQATALRSWGEAAARRTRGRPLRCRPFRLDALPARPTLEFASSLEAESVRGPRQRLIVAVGGDDLRALGPDLETSSCFLVAGPQRSGRSTTLLLAARSALLAGCGVVALAPRASPLRDLAGISGVGGVLIDDLSVAAIEDAVRGADRERVVIVVDDAETLRDSAAGPFLLKVIRGEVPGTFVLLGGHHEGLAVGATGWLAEARKARQGLLLMPREPRDGELVGIRLARGALSISDRLGRGWLHLGDGIALPVAALTPSRLATLNP